MPKVYKVAGLQVQSDITEVTSLDVSAYVKDIHEMQPLDYVELDDGRKFLVVEFEMSMDANPKAFVSMKLPPSSS